MKRAKFIICFIISLMMLFGVISSSTVVSNAEDSYSVEILKKIGLYSAPDSSANISYFDCALLLLAAQGKQNTVLNTSGDVIITHSNSVTKDQAVLIRNYFSTNTDYNLKSVFGGSVSSVPPVSGNAVSNNSKVPSYVIYKCMFIGLGYLPGRDFTDTPDGIFSFAAKIGFNEAYLIKKNESIYNDLAEIFYETLFRDTLNGGTLLKYMCSMNATLNKAADDNGMFDSPTTSLPDFTYGTMLSGSYKQTIGKFTECEIKYSKVSLQNVNSYLSVMKNASWAHQVTYNKKVTSNSSTAKETHYTYKKTISGKEYFAVIIFNESTGIITLWYAY